MWKLPLFACISMTHLRPLFLLACAAVASAQGVDSILLLNSIPIRQVAADPQGNLLVARAIDATPQSPIAVFRYGPQGQLLDSFTQSGKTVPAGGQPVVLTADSQGAIYLASGATLLRPTDSSPQLWTPQLPATTFQIEGIAFDTLRNPIVLLIDTTVPGVPHARVRKLDRATGQTLADFDAGGGLLSGVMTVDSQGAVYLTGAADAPEGMGGYVAKLDPTLQQLVYLTYVYGGIPRAIAIDSAGAAYVAKSTYQILSLFAGGLLTLGENALVKLDPSGALTTLSNTYGGMAIAFDGSGNLIVTGGIYPPTAAFQVQCGPRSDTGGFSVTVVDPATLQPRSSALLAQQTWLSASAPLSDGSLYVAATDNRVLHIDPAAPSSPVACVVNGASFRVEPGIVAGQLLTIFGRGLGSDPISVYNDSQQLPTSSGSTEVRIGGFAAPLLAVSSTQINAIVPYAINELNLLGRAPIEISHNGRIIYTWQVNVGIRNPSPLLRFDPVTGALDFFQAQSSVNVFGSYAVPLADVLNEDGSHNSAANPARLGSTVTIFGSGFGELGGRVVDGAPGGDQPLAPANYPLPTGLPVTADLPVVTPYGNLTLGFLPITTIVGRTNSVLQVKATIPASFPAVPLPFVIGPPDPKAPVWTNFLYVSR